jgi:hypothetical protein
MTEVMVNFSHKKIRYRPLTLTTANSWASYVRRRWHANTLAQIQTEWDLSESQARSLLYAQASQRTIDLILNHKNGGFMLGLDLLCIRMQVSLEAVADKLEQEEINERVSREARNERQGRALRSLESRSINTSGDHS